MTNIENVANDDPKTIRVVCVGFVSHCGRYLYHVPGHVWDVKKGERLIVKTANGISEATALTDLFLISPNDYPVLRDAAETPRRLKPVLAKLSVLGDMAGDLPIEDLWRQANPKSCDAAALD